MQSKSEKFLKGVITEDEAISGAVDSLKEQNYQFVQNLGSGSFGTVFYAINQQSENMAVKIVLKEKVNENELKIWPTLRNRNILPLNEVQYIPCCGTFAFFMPLISTSLDLVLEDSMFSVNKNGIEIAKSYLKDVLRGVDYLHSRKLCHLDIKPSNVLICNSGKAILCDFSSLTLTEAGTVSYASPFLYRPPEAVISENNKKTVVNGFLYDVYTIGFLALELFTNQAVLKACRSIETDSTWDMQIYPKLFEVLKKKSVEKVVKKAFLESEIDKKLVNILLNFVKSCLSLNPRIRPSLDDMKDHKIFGGSRLFQTRKNDVWEQKATSKKLNFLISLFIAQASSLSLPPESDNSTYIAGSKSQEKQNIRCDVGDQIQIIPDRVKHLPERDSEAKSSKKHMNFMKWMADNKSRFYNRFNLIFSALRRSRK